LESLNRESFNRDWRRGLLAALGIALLLLCAYAGYFRFAAVLKSGPLETFTPSVPAVETAGIDPAVASLIHTTIDEVNRAAGSGSAWGKLGSVLMHYEFIEQAALAFERAERLSPQDARWPYLHGLLLMNAEPDAALTNLHRATELTSQQSNTARFRLGQFLQERGRNDEAEAHFQRLLQREPEHKPALLGLARINRQRGRLLESSNLLSRCLHDAHTAKSANAELASVQRALANIPAAEEASRRSASLSADQPWPDPFWEEAASYRVGRKALIQDATSLMDQGRVADAVPILTSVIRDYEDDEEGWYLLGWAYNQHQQPAQAERALREHTSPQSPKGRAQLAVALLNQKRFAEALEVLAAALQLKPTWRELHYNSGYACAQLGRTNAAISHLRNALVRDPNYVPTYTALAEILIGQGEKEEPLRLLSQALYLSPSDDRAKALLKRINPSGEGSSGHATKGSPH
jgi:tetratricopeptide (TPR) repeat protein